MSAKVINLTSIDGDVYELTFTRESAEATERNGFEIGEFMERKGLLKNSKALFEGAFIARNRGIKRKTVDALYASIGDKEGLLGVLLEMYMETVNSLIGNAENSEDKNAKNATWEVV